MVIELDVLDVVDMNAVPVPDITGEFRVSVFARVLKVIVSLAATGPRVAAA
jgi:hypothetical protein